MPNSVQVELVEWLQIVKGWQQGQGPTGTGSALREVESLSGLTNLLLNIKETLVECGTVEEGLERLAGLGQLLGRLCTRPALLCDQTFLQVLLDCLLWFYVPVPLSAVQHKAKTWVVSQLKGLLTKQGSSHIVLHDILKKCGLSSTSLDNVVFNELVNCDAKQLSGSPPPSGFLTLAKTSATRLTDCYRLCLNLRQNQFLQQFADKLLQMGLQQYSTDSEMEQFLAELTKSQEGAYEGKVVLELGRDTLEQLWHRYPASLEQEVLSVLELVCQNPELSIQQLQQMVSHRGLLEACHKSSYIEGNVQAMLLQVRSQASHTSSLFTAVIRLETLISAPQHS